MHTYPTEAEISDALRLLREGEAEKRGAFAEAEAAERRVAELEAIIAEAGRLLLDRRPGLALAALDRAMAGERR